MKSQKKLRERYIQLVETFINAIESGKSGTELEEIRGEIRILSAALNLTPPVENHTHKTGFPPLNQRVDEKNNGVDTTIS